MLGIIYSYGIILQALAVIHFIRRRPDTYWLFIIVMFGGIGALAYIFIEVIPDFGLLRTSFQVFPRRKRIKALESMIVDNPSIGNYEELGDLYLDDGQFVKARESFDKVLAKEESIDPLYRRGLCALALNEYPAAVADLEKVTALDPKYRLPARCWASGACPREDRTTRPGERTFRRGDRNVDAVRNTVQLCVLPCRDRPRRGSTRVGGTDPAKESDDARLYSPPRASMVS